MSDADRGKWDARYRTNFTRTPQPCQALIDFEHLLPQKGNALDLASGHGGNALYLARRGLDTHAWDISTIVLEQLSELARDEGLELHTLACDVAAQPPEPESFDIIVVSRFLYRPLCDHIAAALRPGGILFYQTFTRTRVEGASGPSNPDYLLQENELLRLFPNLQTLAYREEMLHGDTTRGMRNEAYLIALRKNASSF